MGKPRPSALRNLSLYVVTNAASVLLPMLTLPIFTRMITPTQYGLLAMLAVVGTVGIGLTNWGLLPAFNRYYFDYGRDPKKQLRLLGTILTFTLSCLAVIYLPVIIFRDTLAQYQTNSTQWTGLLLIVFASMSLKHVNGILFQYFKNAERAGLFAIFELLQIVLNTACSLVLVVGFKQGIRGLALGGLISQSIVCAAMMSRFHLADLRPDKGILIECLAFGWPLMAKVMINLINISIDRQMIGKYKSMTDVGLYDRAQAIAILIFMFMTTVQNVYGPRWNKRIFQLPDADHRSLSSLFTEYVCLIIVPAVVLVLFCHEALFIMTPSSYHNAAPLIVLLATYYALLSFGKLFGPISNYLKLTRFQGVITFITYGCNIGLNWLLIRDHRFFEGWQWRGHALPVWEWEGYGAFGAVVATFITGLGSMLLIAWACQKRYHVRLEKRPLALLFGGLIVFAAVSIATFYEAIPYWPSLALRSVLFVAYMVMWTRIVGWGMIRSIILRGLTGVGLRPPDTLRNGES